MGAQPAVNQSSLRIGGLTLAMSGPCSVIHQDPASCYQSFLEAGQQEAVEADVRIRFELGNMPSTETLSRVFDGDSWSMFQDSQFHYLKLQPPGFCEPRWLARLDRDAKQVTVYCGSALVGERDGGIALSSPVHYPLDQLLLMYALAARGGMVVHAAGANFAGRGLVFPGSSSAGKTTLSRQLLGHRDIDVFSDDRIIVRKMDGAFRMFGTPWPGDAGIARNASAPLVAILFLQHAERNALRPLSLQQAVERLLPVTSIPWYDAELVPLMLSVCETLVTAIPAFEFGFTPGPEVAGFLREFASAPELGRS